MSSELKLSGTSGGNIILQGDDVITSDQTFTFPATGGEVVTAPTGGSVVGYQQGVWTPATNGTATVAKGTWTRIGNQVTANFNVSNDAGQTGVSPFEISDLPYPRQSSTDNEVDDALRCGGFLAWSNIAGPRTLMFGGSGTVIQFRVVSSTSNTDSITGTAGFSFRGTVIYLTDDTTWTPQNGATVS